MTDPVTQREVQALLADRLRGTSHPREQWQRIAALLDGQSLERRLAMLPHLRRLIQVPDQYRSATKGWLAGAFAGEKVVQLTLVRNLNVPRPKRELAQIHSLLTSPFLGPLARLKLFGHQLSSGIVDSLAESRSCASLTVLNLSANQLDLDGLRALATSGALPRLRSLYLGRNPLGEAAVDVILGYRWFTQLRGLDLRETGISERGFARLQASELAAHCEFRSEGSLEEGD